MLQSRDRKLIRFLDAFGCARTAHIKNLFFPNVSIQRCNQRLKYLYDKDAIDRDRTYASQDYLYFLKKPREIEHMLQRVEAYTQLSKITVLNEFIPEYALDGLRADAYFETWHNGIITPYFLEVQRSSNFRQNKYEAVYHSGAWSELWDDFPAVIVLSDKSVRIKPSNIKYQVVDEIKKGLA